MRQFLSWIKKAIVAGAVAGGATFYAIYPGGITSDEWIKLVLAILAAGYSVYKVTNGPRPA